MPYKDFQVNEILTAADVNSFLMKQAVMTFADSTARATALGTPTAGMMSFLTASTAVEVYSGSTAVGWTAITGGGGGGVVVGTAAPSTPAEGDLWWDSDNGKLYVYYVDGTSNQWVDAAGPSVAVQSTAPTGYEGQLWLDDTDGSMYVYYTDPGGASSQWIGAVSRSGGILQVVSTTKTDTFTMSSTTFADVTGLSVSITPRSTSSKIIVLPYVVGGATRTTVEQQLRLMRDSTVIAVGDAAGSRQRLTFGIQPADADSVAAATPIFLDSPNTTSTVTYKIQTRGNTANTVSINRNITDSDAATTGRSISSITVIEVAG
jgi:hypothetical protein